MRSANHLKFHLLILSAALLAACSILGAATANKAWGVEDQVAPGLIERDPDPPVVTPPEGPQPTPAVVETDENGNKYLAGEFVVIYKDKSKAKNKPANGDLLDAAPQIGMQHVEFKDVKTKKDKGERKKLFETKEAILKQDKDIESVTPNYLAEANWTPNDPRLSQQSNALPILHAQRSWGISRGSTARIVVIDSGYDTNHPEFPASKIAGAYDFYNRNNRAEDQMGHGTHVASIAAAATNNGRGIAGGAPNARLLIAKTQVPGYYTMSGTIEAITWGADNGGDVINMSFGFTGGAIPAFQRAVNYAWNKGALPVAAVGNEGKYKSAYPAAYDHVVGVGAVDGNGYRTSWSNYGPAVDLMAPGSNIMAAVPDRTYMRLSGTSMSAPYVTALAALLESQKPSRGSAEKYRLMLHTARDMGPGGRDNYYGHGRVNYEAALRRGR